MNNLIPDALRDPAVLQAGQVLSINKPLRWTSFDIIKKLRTVLPIRKMGHAGTLDPLATGLLLICTGQKTKSISEFQDLEKVYTGTMVLGKTTPSIDLETPFDSERAYDHVRADELQAAANTFVGVISQVPPIYSAIKRQGKRAYKGARRGEDVVLEAREVFVRSFQIVTCDLPTITFEITCGKGTYIRSLVRDLGECLGTGAYMSALCRTRIGDHSLKDAYEMDAFQQLPPPASRSV